MRTASRPDSLDFCDLVYSLKYGYEKSHEGAATVWLKG